MRIQLNYKIADVIRGNGIETLLAKLEEIIGLREEFRSKIDGEKDFEVRTLIKVLSTHIALIEKRINQIRRRNSNRELRNQRTPHEIMMMLAMKEMAKQNASATRAKEKAMTSAIKAAIKLGVTAHKTAQQIQDNTTNDLQKAGYDAVNAPMFRDNEAIQLQLQGKSGAEIKEIIEQRKMAEQNAEDKELTDALGIKTQVEPDSSEARNQLKRDAYEKEVIEGFDPSTI